MDEQNEPKLENMTVDQLVQGVASQVWQNGRASAFMEYVNEMKRRLQSEARWIPVSERLPDENKLILLHDRVSGEPVFAYLASGLHGLHWTIDSKNYSVHGYSNQYTLWKYVTPPTEG